MITETENNSTDALVAENKGEPEWMQPVDSMQGGFAEDAPAAQAAEQAEMNKREYWSSVLTGNPDTVPLDVCERAGATRADMSREQQLYTLCSAVNRSWVADYKGVPRMELQTNWKKHRAQLAAELGTAENEQEVFMALSDRVAEEPRRKLARRVYEQAYMAALNGESEWTLPKEEAAGLSEQDRLAAAVVARNAGAEGRSERERLLPVAQQLAEGMDVFAAVEEDAFSAPRVFAGAPGLWQAVDALADMPEDERQRVAYLARRLEADTRRERGDSPAAEDGLLTRSLRAIRRGASSLGYGALQAINHAGIATLNNAGDLLGGEWGQDMKDGAANWDLRMQMLDEVRRFTQEEVVPLLPEGASRAETYFLDAMQTVPSAVLSCCGGAGFAALALSGMGASVAEARRRSPETPQNLQLAAGVVGGAVQGGIYMALGRLGGKMLEQNISRFMRARGSGLVNYSLAALKSGMSFTAEGVKMMLAGKAAAAVDLAAHEIAARAAATASNIDWKQFGNNLTDIEHNMREAATLLPFLLIGAGRVALRHFRSADSVLGSGRRLLDWKMDEKKVDEILRERDIDARNERLKDALRECELWKNNRCYSFDIMRAMSLLNVDGMKLFRNAKDVCDFLHLPAVFTAEQGQRSAPAAGEKATAGRALREEWEQLAGIWEGPGDLAQLSQARGAGRRALMNGRGRYGGHYYFSYDHPLQSGKVQPLTASYAPGTAEARRQEVTARFDELRALSGRLLLQLYSDDVCTAAGASDAKTLRAEAEKTRSHYLRMAAACVSGRARGSSEKVVFDSFARECGELLSRYRDGAEVQRTGWLQKVPQEFLDNIDRYCLSLDNRRMLPYPELREFFWLMYRTRVCAAVLGDLLPMEGDFQTLLATRHSPAAAYEHLLARELPELGVPQPPAVGDSAPDGDTTAAGRVALYSRLTGARMETGRNDKGETLYRMRRPDGRMTPWHRTREAVENDVAGNAAFSFMPLGTPLDSWLKREFDNPACLSQLPAAGERDYSGHDQLCAAALRDLSRLWLEDATHLQPGLHRESMYRAERVLRESVNSRPLLEHVEPGHFNMESKSTITPYSLALGRFIVYWTHQLNEGGLSAEHAADFLMEQGLFTPSIRQQVLDMGKPPLMPRSRKVPLKETPPPDIEGRNRKLGEALGLFTLRYFLSRLPEMPVPDSVKNWYAQAAFSPEYRLMEGPPKKGTRLDIHRTRKQYNLLGWLNHQSIHQLRAIAPYVQKYREVYANGLPDSHIASLMPGAYSADMVQQLEQAWAHRGCGDGVFHYAQPRYWVLLRNPVGAWNEMPMDERRKLVAYLNRTQDGLLPADAGETMPTALQHLAEVLQQHPDLHYYGAVEGDWVWRLHFREPRTALLHPEQKEGNYETAASMREDYLVRKELLPDFIAESESVREALATLNLLRAYPGKAQAYYDGVSICWNGKRYGVKLTHPSGLQNWVSRHCLKPLRQLLWMVIQDAKESDGKTLNVAGVEVPVLMSDELEPPPLSNVTVYKSDYFTNYMYRLMPGMSFAPTATSRRPYIVGVNQGIHIGTKDGFGKNETPVLQLPLDEFTFVFAPLPCDWTLTYDTLRRRTVLRSLSRVFHLADLENAMPGTNVRGLEEMPELMMRLFEDTGYSTRLYNRSLEELNAGEARALQLAANMLACLNVPSSGYHSDRSNAYSELWNTAESIRQHPQYLFEIVEALVSGNPPSKETSTSIQNIAALDAGLEVDEYKEKVTLDAPIIKEVDESKLSIRELILYDLGVAHITREWVEALSEGFLEKADELEALWNDPEWVKKHEDGQRRLREHRERIKYFRYGNPKNWKTLPPRDN
ncbi:MAG: hypothetical protein IJN29_01140 [Akkermansia sp.]|nr:hypothetical protein [Akkermansia sp.]